MLEAEDVSVGEDWRLREARVNCSEQWLAHQLRLSSVQVCNTGVEGQQSREQWQGLLWLWGVWPGPHLYSLRWSLAEGVSAECCEF